jgi:hypothetical protein
LASPSELVGLVALVATASTSTTTADPSFEACPGEAPFPIVAYATDAGPRYGVVRPDDPILERPLKPEEEVTLFVLATQDLAAAAREAPLRCAEPVTVHASRLVRPASGAPLFEAVPMPTVAPMRGVIDAGDVVTARVAKVLDLATVKDASSYVLPTFAESFRAVNVDGGVTLAADLSTPALGRTRTVFGPVLRLGATTATSSSAAPYPSKASAWLSYETIIRRELDDDEGVAAVGAPLRGAAPGLGAVDLRLAPAVEPLHDPGEWSHRFLVAHGLAMGLPSLSLSFSLVGSPGCVTMCDAPFFGFDKSWLERFVMRSEEDVRGSQRLLLGLEIATYGLAALTTLVPTARRGLLSRFEIAEDALIVVEGVLVALTTPYFLQARLGRNRPVAFHPTLAAAYDEKASLVPPLMSFHANAAGAAWGATTTLLVVEEAGWGWVLASTLLMGAMTAAVSWAEVDAGLAFPSDVLLSGIYGFLNGGGTVLWHEIFWRGWPGSDRGNLPLRIHGVRVDPAPGGTIVSAAASF